MTEPRRAGLGDSVVLWCVPIVKGISEEGLEKETICSAGEDKPNGGRKLKGVFDGACKRGEAKGGHMLPS